MSDPRARLPRFAELPVAPELPPGSSWGLWGSEDQLGTLNLLTNARTLAAARLVESGAVFPLNLPLHEPEPHLAWRTPPLHRLLHVGHEARGVTPDGTDDPSQGFIDRDDFLDGLWLQGGSQWDSLSHIRHPRHGNYNGVADADIHAGPGAKLGIDRWAARAVVGRGVLLDLRAHAVASGIDYDPISAHAFSVEDVSAALARQRTTIEEGDILLLHTGWVARFLAGSPEERARWIAWDGMRAAGLEASDAMVEFLWDSHISAVASDTVGVEVLGPESDFRLHQALLPLLGMPLGELWALADLAADCERDGRYCFLLVSVPLHLRGGVGSPPQAVAIK
jgi:kynurenine formamidase